MESLISLFDQLNWEKADNYPEGTFKKTLRDEDGALVLVIWDPYKTTD